MALTVKRVEPARAMEQRQRAVHIAVHPSGIADIDGERVDVVSTGELIDAGAAIEVVRVDGNRVVVRQQTNPNN